jgi:hypothetical protein
MRAAAAADDWLWSRFMPREQAWPFKTPEGVVGWRWRSRENDLYELSFLRPPWRGSPLLHLVGRNERPN